MNQQEIELEVEGGVAAGGSMCSLVRVEAVTDQAPGKWRVYLRCSRCGALERFPVFTSGFGMGVRDTVKNQVQQHEATH